MKSRFQFRLQTLFIVVTAVAVGCWPIVRLLTNYQRLSEAHQRRIRQLDDAIRRKDAAMERESGAKQKPERRSDQRETNPL